MLGISSCPGQGFRDLLWLPIEQYRKDGRLMRRFCVAATSAGSSTARRLGTQQPAGASYLGERTPVSRRGRLCSTVPSSPPYSSTGMTVKTCEILGRQSEDRGQVTGLEPLTSVARASGPQLYVTRCPFLGVVLTRGKGWFS